jgi:hypothetical protein
VRNRRVIRRVLALALALCAPAAQAAELTDLGTLFLSPQERTRLDQLRRGEPLDPVDGQPGRRQSAPELTGFVQRSDGKNTIWVDGRARDMAASRGTPPLDPKAVRGYSQNPDGVRVERKTPR